MPPVVREEILGGMRKYLTLNKTKYRNILSLEPALILTLTKIYPRTETRSIISLKGQNHINN
jgi:hypothetical protein